MIPILSFSKLYVQFFLNLSIFEIQLKINLFKLGKNKRFNYNPRYFKDHTKKNIYSIDSAYQKNRDFRSSADISYQWKQARLNSRNRKNKFFSSRILIIIFVLLFLFLILIDFDISIFFKQ